MLIKIYREVEKFVEELEAQTIAKVLRTIDLLEKFENRLSMPHSKKVTNGIFELRIRGQQEVRIFYCFYKDSICLLHGFLKKTRQTPTKELQSAINKYKTLTSL